ncbi:unnamed protein product [Caenorhabditis sp. 36 PRJEB53466]|nr:unnamed protein product [Caenorhabditis sp. 36 PRJEB53466]
MAREMNTFIVSIDYRLSPETVFPNNLLDCEKAVDYLFSHGKDEFGIDTSRIAIVGDSAGGNLAAAITQRRVRRGEKPEISAQVLIYPLLQLLDLQTVSYRYFHKRLNGFAFVDPESVAFYYMLYAGVPIKKAKELVPVVTSNGHVKKEHLKKIEEKFYYRNTLESDYAYNHSKIPERWPVKESKEAQDLLDPLIFNPDFSPLLRENLENLPKSLVITCEYDILRDEGIIYAQRLKAAGVPTKMINYKNGFHAMLNMHNEVTEASGCLTDVMEWMVDNTMAPIKK